MLRCIHGAALTHKIGQHLAQQIDCHLQAMVPFDSGPGIRPHALAQVRIGRNFDNQVGDRGGIANQKQEPVLAIIDDLARAAISLARSGRQVAIASR